MIINFFLVTSTRVTSTSVGPYSSIWLYPCMHVWSKLARDTTIMSSYFSCSIVWVCLKLKACFDVRNVYLGYRRVVPVVALPCSLLHVWIIHKDQAYSYMGCRKKIILSGRCQQFQVHKKWVATSKEQESWLFIKAACIC